MIMREKNRRKLHRDAGSTMVETLVSFVVLFIVLAALYGIVSFSSGLYMKSVDTSRVHQRFYQEIYKFPSGDTTGLTINYDTDFLEVKTYQSGNVSSENDGQEYASIALMLDKDKTSPDNYNSNSKISDAVINMSKIGVTSFVCKGENDNEEELVLPKALHFWWDKPDGN